MAALSPSDLLYQLETLNGSDLTALPSNLKSQLSSAAKKLNVSLETPTDAISRVLLTQPVEAVTIRIAADLGLFSALGSKTLSVTELAQMTGAEPELLIRILRSLGAFDAVKEVSDGQFAPSPSFALFKDAAFEKAFGGCQNILDKTRQAIPAYLAAAKYRSPRDPNDTAVQFAYDTKGKSYVESLMSDPASASALGSFVTLMSVWADGFTQMHSVYPVTERLERGFDPATVMFVDVGGGLGQKAIALKKAYPALSGRFVVQDTPNVLANADPDSPAYAGIELHPHDFTTEQPIKGARCYYIRQCLHNWPDDVCVTILRRLKEAATPGYSRILIHEIIVPVQGASPWIASQDFNMMSMFAVGERTEAAWQALIQEAGLKISHVYLDDHPSREGIIEVEI